MISGWDHHTKKKEKKGGSKEGPKLSTQVQIQTNRMYLIINVTISVH